MWKIRNLNEVITIEKRGEISCPELILDLTCTLGNLESVIYLRIQEKKKKEKARSTEKFEVRGQKAI